MKDLVSWLTCRPQLTTDGHAAYVTAVEGAFGSSIDYSVLINLYGLEPKESEGGYSNSDCIGTEARVIQGNPVKAHISTSYVEVANLTMRTSMRRFTRLINAFSKKLENHMYALGLHFMYYNFAWPHKSLRNPYKQTPAMEAGVSDHIWAVQELLGLLSI